MPPLLLNKLTCNCVYLTGYTLAFWVNFEKPTDREMVYLSNGGHTLESHGVAMLYDKGNMEFRFRQKNGKEVMHFLIMNLQVVPHFDILSISLKLIVAYCYDRL